MGKKISMNKDNLLLCLLFIAISCLLVVDLFNNLEEIVQRELNQILVLLIIFTVSNSCIAIYFGSTIRRKNESITSRVLGQ